jgi:hypothetical protein
MSAARRVPSRISLMDANAPFGMAPSGQGTSRRCCELSSVPNRNGEATTTMVATAAGFGATCASRSRPDCRSSHFCARSTPARPNTMARPNMMSVLERTGPVLRMLYVSFHNTRPA